MLAARPGAEQARHRQTDRQPWRRAQAGSVGSTYFARLAPWEALLRWVSLRHAEGPTSSPDQIATASSSNAVASRRVASSSTASS